MANDRNGRTQTAAPLMTNRRWLLAGVAVLALAGGVWWYMKPSANAINPAAGGMGLPVEATPATTGELANILEVVGQMQANQGVELRNEVTGKVASVNVKDGSPVKAGDLLVVLDDGVQKAALAQAEANNAVAQANIGRYQRLREQDAVSQLQLDQAIAEAKVAAANVQSARANLDKMRIKAPFAGVAGIVQVTPGQLLETGTLLVAVTDNATLKVTFKVPESQAQGLKVGLPVEVKADDGSVVYGEIGALDGRIDPATRTLQAKVLLDNTSNTLVAGQFVRVAVPVQQVSNAVLVPDVALVPQGNKMIVWVVGKDSKISPTLVEVGLRGQNKAQITKGLSAGDMVMVAGQQKAQPGMPVTVMSPTTITVAPTPVETLE